MSYITIQRSGDHAKNMSEKAMRVRTIHDRLDAPMANINCDPQMLLHTCHKRKRNCNTRVEHNGLHTMGECIRITNAKAVQGTFRIFTVMCNKFITEP